MRCAPFVCAIAAVAVCFALDWAQAVFAPVLTAVVIGVVLAPLVDRIGRLGFHPALAAFAVLFVFVLVAFLLFVAIEPTVSDVIRNAPLIWEEVRIVVETVKGAFSGVQELQSTVADALSDGETPAEADTDPVPIPGVLDALSYGPSVLSALLIFLGTLYFFLVSRSDVYDKLANLVPTWSQARMCEAERRVSQYFLTISMINAGFGLIVALAMSVLGMPQPILWGLATFLLNYLMYLGPASIALALLVVGVVTFDGAFSFLPAAVFVTFNMIEAQFVTPTLVGHRMALNPLFVFLSFVFWLWLWGPVGGLIAIPLLVWVLFVFAPRNAEKRTDTASST
ncbi:AI-2E family transporter [Tropicimonas sp. S265A]|uniref:AI-2E family transporter n=1 Tax=Tropicimonas sp. S265A TaxID=3415134 RepID=UPI003C7AD81C